MLTAAQLYDLIKARKQPTRMGSRGGHYYETTTGKRVYVGHAEEGVTQPLAHVVALTPHSSAVKQSRTGPMEGPVSVTVLPPQRGPRGLSARPKASSRPKGRLSDVRWKAFFCKNCGTSVSPHYDVPVVHGFQVETDPETGKVSGHQTDEMVKPVKERETLKVHLTAPSGKKEVLEGYDPEAAAAKLCPSCFADNRVISSKVTRGAAKLKLTPEEKVRAKEAAKERKQQQKELEKLTSKFPEGVSLAVMEQQGKITSAQRKLIEGHRATQAVASRVADDKTKAEERIANRQVREGARLERAEDEAREKLRGSYQRHLEQTGHPEADAAKLAQQASPQDLAKFASEQSRFEADRAEATRKKLSEESQGKRIPVSIDVGAMLDHMIRRRLKLPGGEENAAFRETLMHPLTRRQEEEKRTERLRERMAEKESKVKKSLGLWIRI